MPEPVLLIVEDDEGFARSLKKSFERRGYKVVTASASEEVEPILDSTPPNHAVVDLKLGARSGLDCLQRLHAHNPAMRIVVLTGFASISTAVVAIKLGACDYLLKPANTDEIENAFHRSGGNARAALSEQPTSIKTLEWEHIHRVLAETGFNISEAARRLGMHRRTLARKLNKRHFR
jgi:two-component system, response regulator RegA